MAWIRAGQVSSCACYGRGPGVKQASGVDILVNRPRLAVQDMALIDFSPEDSLPANFDTPMFWSDREIEELRGTAVIGVWVFRGDDIP